MTEESNHLVFSNSNQHPTEISSFLKIVLEECPQTENVGSDNDLEKQTLESLQDMENLCDSGIHICHLCAHFRKADLDHTDYIGEWISMSDMYLQSSETIHAMIVKYIPSVFMKCFPESDKIPDNFLKEICSPCYANLQSTKAFFDKIQNGRERTMKVLLQLYKIQEQIDKPDVVKKRRGRPKKQSRSTELEIRISEVKEECRSKRSSRLPAKYSSDYCINSLAVADKNCSDNLNSCSRDLEEKHTDDTSNLPSKLNQNIEPKLTGEEITLTPDSLQVSASDPKKTQDSCLKVDESAEEIVKSDSDVSVKLSDLVRGRKIGTRRKRGRPKVKRKCNEFRCDACEKVYCSQSSLIYHKLTVHENKQDFECTLCKKTFSHKSLLTNHMFSHYSEKYFTCDVSECNSSFKSRSSLYTHTRAVHLRNREKEFTCDKCGIQFTLKSSLIAHLRTHTGEKPFSCQFCGKSFSHRGNMKEHIRTHTKEKPYVCTQADCGKRFATSSQLRTHKLTHSESKSFLCIECGKGFTTRERLKYHIKRHNGEKFMECSDCHRTFTDALGLRKHKRIHTGEKPYQCLICKKTFSDPSNLTKHKKVHSQTTNSIEVPEETTTSIILNAEKPHLPECVANDGRTSITKHEDSPMHDDAPDSNLVNESENLIQILTPEAYAALSCNSVSVPSDGNVIYLYQSSDLFAMASVDQPTIEVAANETVTLSGVIGNLTVQDEVLTFATETHDS